MLLSYFLSQDAKISRGVLMGAQIAFFHVVSAIVIVVVVHLILQQAFGGPVDEMDFLKIASYGAITLIGAAMLRGSFRRLRRAGSGHGHAGHRHDHGAPGHVPPGMSMTRPAAMSRRSRRGARAACSRSRSASSPAPARC